VRTLKIAWSLFYVLVIVRILMMAVGFNVDGNADRDGCDGG